MGLGTWFGLSLGGSAWALASAITVLCGCVAMQLLGRGRAASVGVHLLVVLVAWCGAALSEGGLLEEVLGAGYVPDGSLVEAVGRVRSDASAAGAGNGAHGVRFRLAVSSVSVGGNSLRARDVVLVTIYGSPHHPPVYGEKWRVTGRLWRSPRRRSNRSLFTLHAGLGECARLERSHLAPMAWFFAARAKASSMLTRGIEAFHEVSGVVTALVLGYRTRLSPDVRESFVRTGTMHVFAISGLHVGMLCAVIVFALGVLGLPRTMWVLALAPLIGAYACVTGGRASAVRACAMAIAYLAAPLFRRRPDAITALAMAGVVILIWNPAQLTDMGFIYSFAVVSGIMFIVPLFDGIVSPLWQADPLSMPEMDAVPAWWRGLLRTVLRVIMVSVAAWLTSTPLSLHFFGRFCPVALLGNIIALPLAFLILTTGCLSVAGGALFGGIGEVFNYANWVFARLLIAAMRGLERIPFGWVECERISGWAVILWYGVLAAAVVWLRRRQAVR
jgi:ComEC/Rec2-related protein